MQVIPYKAWKTGVTHVPRFHAENPRFTYGYECTLVPKVRGGVRRSIHPGPSLALDIVEVRVR
jgi:hypothetical protein